MGPDSESVVVGLLADVEITTDEWGIPHVVASSAHDAFFGQGYAQARMRLFQMDLWRRRGLGLLSEVLGEKYLELDVAARTFLSRGDLAVEFAAYPERDCMRICAFVAGINAWIDEVLADHLLLPPEFSVLGFSPDRWSASDLLRIRIHGLSSNAEQEVARTETLTRFGPDIERLRRVTEPQHRNSEPLFDPALIDESVLAVYRAAHEDVFFDSAPRPVPPDGSNNWAISGSRTRSGRPIVANDPHRIMTFPSLRVLIHVTCPEFDVIGMQEPYLPAVLVGHNNHVAFGITIAPADLEDLYVYDLHPTNDDQYRSREGWVSFETVEENFLLADGTSVHRKMRFTRHGPVLSIDRERRAVVAIRAAWLEPGMTPYLASVAFVDTQSVDDYLDRLHGWGNPVLNHVVADTEGRIAWQVAGRVPERPNWDGLLPVPGDGSHEWSGMRTAADLPRLVDPPSGWVRSANQFNLAEDADWQGTPTSYEWYSGFRARRLASRLAESDNWTVEESAAMQNDYFVEPAAELMTLFAAPFDDPDAEFARAELLAWDQRMLVDSRAAAIFDRWLYSELPRQLRREAARRLAPEQSDAAAAMLLDARLLTLGDPRTELRLLEESAAWEQSETFTSTHNLVSNTLAATVASLREQLGSDPADWVWGAIHFSHLRHPLHGFDGLGPELTDTGAHPKAGSSDTLGVAFGPDGVQTLGAATRIVMDVGDWDASLWINSPGQDGALDSPHARDLLDTWLADGYHPLLYSRARIGEHAESRHRLLPQPPQTFERTTS